MKHQNLNGKKFEKSGNWGLSASVDLYGCNPKTIRNAKKIKQFVYELCDLIEMKRFGECKVVNFGEDEKVAGYSMVQLIETSLIAGHFANQTNSAYLDIFSCKYFDPKITLRFAKKFFGAKTSVLNYNLRK